MLFNFSSPEYLSHHRTRKNRVSPVSQASPAHMNSPYKYCGIFVLTYMNTILYYIILYYIILYYIILYYIILYYIILYYEHVKHL